MRVLIACEFSGVVREAFRKRGHDAWSCDVLPAEDNSRHHIRTDVIGLVSNRRHPDAEGDDPDGRPLVWDLMVAHPPCTHLASSGARWFHLKAREQQEALDFVRALMDAPIERIALENPVGVISTAVRRPDQIVQPFHFGDPFRKTTCLWLKNLPLLVPTSDMQTGEQKCWKEPPHPERWKRRSRTYQGIADAIAEQWGAL